MAVLALATFASAAYAQSDAKPNWSLRTSTPSAALVGEWELASRSNGMAADSGPGAADAARASVARGASFQLRVKLVDPTGSITDITGSPKLIYRPKGCMAVDAGGVATVLQTAAPPWTCGPGDAIPLTIIYADAPAGVAAMNMYVFTID